MFKTFFGLVLMNKKVFIPKKFFILGLLSALNTENRFFHSLIFERDPLTRDFFLSIYFNLLDLGLYKKQKKRIHRSLFYVFFFEKPLLPQSTRIFMLYLYFYTLLLEI